MGNGNLAGVLLERVDHICEEGLVLVELEADVLVLLVDVEVVLVLEGRRKGVTSLISRRTRSRDWASVSWHRSVRSLKETLL